MEVLGYRSTTHAATAAVWPHHKLLAVANAARADGDGDHSGGGASHFEILRLWRGEGETNLPRRLQRIATVPCEGDFHRIVWSPSPCGTYPLGLLAAGLDGGVVRVWDPSELSYDPEVTSEEVPEPETDMDKSYTLGVFAGPLLINDPSKLSYLCTPGKSRSETDFPKLNLTKEMESTALTMRKGLEALHMEPLATEVLEGWDIVKKLDYSSSEEGVWEYVSKEVEEEDWQHVSKEVPKDTHLTGGALLKLEDLRGPVRGLAFNFHKTNLLAAAAYGEKLKIYDIDRGFIGSYQVSLPTESQNTFLDWNLGYPCLLASCNDNGLASIFDIRAKKPVSSVRHEGKKYSEAHWKPDDVFVLALSSDTKPIQIYDFRRPGKPTHEFGPAKGVRTLSWSFTTHGSILTTDIDGAMDMWKLDNGNSVDHLSLQLNGNMEARWCQAEDTIVVSSSSGVHLCKLEPPW